MLNWNEQNFRMGGNALRAGVSVSSRSHKFLPARQVRCESCHGSGEDARWGCQCRACDGRGFRVRAA